MGVGMTGEKTEWGRGYFFRSDRAMIATLMMTMMRNCWEVKKLPLVVEVRIKQHIAMETRRFPSN